MYLLRYDHEYERALASEKWAIFLDPSAIKNNFYLNNKNRYGNPIWIMKRIILPITLIFTVLWLTSTAILTHLGAKHDMQHDELTGYMYILLFIWIVLHTAMGIYCWRKYSKFNDNLGIRNEIKYIIILSTVLAVLLIIYTILVLVVDSRLEMMLGIIIPIVGNLYNCVLVLYPEKLNQIKKETSIDTMNNKNKSIEWTEIISTMDGYEQFAVFLGKEFSTENLLFVTEYVQLKQELDIDNINTLKDKIEEMKLEYTLDLPPEIPKSIIAKEFGESDDTNLDKAVFDALNKMFAKYIDSSTATMQVNISSSTSKYMMNIFKNSNNNNIESETILQAMETAVKEISYLMNDSQSRFTKLSIFNELMRVTI